MSRCWKDFEEHDRKNFHCLEQIVSRNMDVNEYEAEEEVRSTIEKTPP